MEKVMKAHATTNGGKFVAKRAASQTNAYCYSEVVKSKHWKVDVVSTTSKSSAEDSDKDEIVEEAHG